MPPRSAFRAPELSPAPRSALRAPHSADFWALKDISFDVQQGEVVGIIGRNGAGKSTLLKILSQITEPTEGEIRMRGRVTSLLSLWLDTEKGQARAYRMNTEENQFFIPVDDVKKQFLSHLRMCA